MESGHILGMNVVGLADGLHFSVKRKRELDFGLNSC